MFLINDLRMLRSCMQSNNQNKHVKKQILITMSITNYVYYVIVFAVNDIIIKFDFYQINSSKVVI